LNDAAYRHQFSINGDAIAVSEETNAMIAAQNHVIQKLTAFCGQLRKRELKSITN